MLAVSKTEHGARIGPTSRGNTEAEMRTRAMVILATTLLVASVPAGAATTKAVSIFSSGFSPKSVTITEGDTVTWVNRDTVNHQVLADRGQFVSPILKPRQTYSFTFNAAGTYGYKDELHPKLKGSVVVKGLPPSLNLAVSAPIILFGDRITLSGTVSNHRSGEQVAIYYQPYPQPDLIQLATVLTGTGGTYSLLVTPKILTTYEAMWKGASATPSTVQVEPKLVLGRSGAWIIHAYAGRSFAGRAVQFQRLNRITGQWVTLRKVILNARSSARIAYRLPKGLNRLRAAMSVNQAGAGFLGATSSVVNWRQPS